MQRSGGGSFRLDGNQIVESEILSTLVGCGGPRSRGSSTPRCSPSSRVRSSLSTQRQHARAHLAVDTTLDPITPDQLVGTYTLGTTPITITPDTVTIDGCERTWSADDGSVVFEPLDCSPPLPLAMTVDEWDSLHGDAQRVLIRGRGSVGQARPDHARGPGSTRAGIVSGGDRQSDMGVRRTAGEIPVRPPPEPHVRGRLGVGRRRARDRLRRLQHVLGQRELDAPTDAGWGLAVTEGRNYTRALQPGPPDRHVDRR